MAANFNGRIIYLDAPGTYNALRDAKEFVRINFVIVYDSMAAEVGTLTLYAHSDATVAATNIGVFTTSGPESEQYTMAPTEDTPPDSFNGLSAVLAGANAKAWIYLQ